MRRILDKLSTSSLLASLIDSTRANQETRISSLAGSLRAIIAALLHQRTGEPILMIFEDKGDADSAYTDLVTLIGTEHALLYQEEHHTAATLRDTLDAEVSSLSDALKS